MPPEDAPAAASASASAAAERRERRRQGILANSDERIKRILTDGDVVRQAPAMEGGDAFKFSFLSENQQPSGNGEASNIKNNYKAWAAESARQQAMIHELEGAVQSMARVISNQQAIRYDLHERINRENERFMSAKAEQRRLRYELDEKEHERARFQEEMKKMQRQRSQHLVAEAQLKGQLSTLNNDLLSLHQELEQRKARVEQLQRDVEARDADLQRTRVVLAQATQELEAANDKNSQLKTLALQYKKKLEEAKMALPAGTAGTTGENLRAQVVSLEEQLGAEQSRANQAVEAARLAEEREAAIASKLQQANERCMAAEVEQRRLRYELDEKEHERARFEEEMKKMQRQAEADAAALSERAQLAERLEQMTSLQQENQGLKMDREKLQRANLEAQRMRTEHVASEAQLKGQLSTVNSDLLKLNQEMEQRKARVEQLQRDVAARDAARSEMAATRQQTETNLRAQLTRTQAERDALKQEKEAMTAKLQAELAKVTQELEAGNGKNSQLKTLALQYKKKFEEAVRPTHGQAEEAGSKRAVPAVGSVSEGVAENVKRLRLEIKQEYEDISCSECVPEGEDTRGAGGRASGTGSNASAQVSRGSRSGTTLRGNPRGIGRGREGGAGGKDGHMST